MTTSTPPGSNPLGILGTIVFGRPPIKGRPVTINPPPRFSNLFGRLINFPRNHA